MVAFSLMSLLNLSQTFPLDGPGSEIGVGLEFVIVFIAMEWFGTFLLNYIQSEDKENEKRNLSWGFIFFGLALTYVFYILGDYFAPTAEERLIWTLLAYLSLAGGATVTMVFTEIIDKSRKRPLSFASIASLVVVIIAVVIKNRDLGFMMAFLGAPLAFIYFIYYIRKLLNVSNRSREVVPYVWGFFSGMILVLIGYILLSDGIIIALGIMPRIIGDLMVIIGFNVFMYSIDNLPSFGEFDWIQKIRTILVINKSGICVFSRFYGMGIGTDNGSKGGPSDISSSSGGKEFLISGALKSIESVMKEMTGNEQLNKVVLQDKSFLFEYREQFTAAIIADEPLKSLQIRLKQLSDKFESIFGEILKDWDGNVVAFLPAEAIADEIFKNA